VRRSKGLETSLCGISDVIFVPQLLPQPRQLELRREIFDEVGRADGTGSLQKLVGGSAVAFRCGFGAEVEIGLAFPIFCDD
jgi:hypothetical protein